MNIDQALKYTGSETVTVSGFLLACDGQTTKLCSELMESFPPQCGGKSLVVRCLKVEAIANLNSAEGCLWSDYHIELAGQLEHGVLSVSG